MKVGVIVDKTFMTELRINHVRHLKDITIPLSNSQPKHLVLTGKNGSGKTSVLKSVVDFLTYVVSRNFYSQAACLESVTFNQKRLQELDNSEQDKQNREGIERDIAFWTRFLDHWIDGTVAEYLSFPDTAYPCRVAAGAFQPPKTCVRSACCKKTGYLLPYFCFIFPCKHFFRR